MRKDDRMEGKTHAVVGMATAISMLQPKDTKELLTALTFGCIGGVICDVDASKSDASKAVNLGIGGVIGLCAITAIADMFYDVMFMQRITESTNSMRVLLGVLLLLSTLSYAKGKPHRTQAHSLLTLPLLCIGLGFIVPDAVRFFAIGFVSHVIIDMLNKKKVYFLYPFNVGVSFGLCKSNGKFSNGLYYIALTTTILLSIIVWYNG